MSFCDYVVTPKMTSTTLFQKTEGKFYATPSRVVYCAMMHILLQVFFSSSVVAIHL